MFVELIETLRCPRDHADAQLVASATRTEDRRILEGVLGCPVCSAEFPIRDGAACFDGAGPVTPAEPPNLEAAMRIAAFLELTDTRGFALICGSAASHAGALFQISETALVLLNPPADVTSPAVLGIVMSRQVAPFAAASARAAALDAAQSDTLVRSVVRALRVGGRIMGPVTMSLPDGVSELARDDGAWVGEKAAQASDPTPRLVTLKRGSG